MTLATSVLAVSTLLAFHPSSAFAADGAALYEQMRDITRREFLLGPDGKDVDVSVQRFVAGAYDLAEGPLQPADVTDAVRGGNRLCDAKEGREFMDIITRCSFVKNDLTAMAEREQAIRTLGTDLQLIANGYERPLLGAASPWATLPAQSRAIDRIWRASAPEGDLNAPLRIIPLPETSRDAVEQIGTQLQSLIRKDGTREDRDDLAATVSRYRFGGYRLVQTGVPLETALAALAEPLAQHQFDPPLRPGDAVLFTMPESFQTELPQNIAAWARVERQTNGTVIANAGLAWKNAIEPVQPSLCTNGEGDCEPILGGDYPEPPRESGLCTDPLARLGYLCRPLEDAQENACVQRPTETPDTITLAACTAPGPDRVTVAGPDVCKNIPWNISGPFDPATQCTVELRCSDDGDYTGGVTEMKTDDGFIDVKVKHHPTGIATYVALHELVHARQMCHEPPNTAFYRSETPDGNPLPPDELREQGRRCCSLEEEAYKVECDAMAADGLFINPSTGKEDVAGAGEGLPGLPFNETTCRQVLTDYSCRNRGFDACSNVLAGRGTVTTSNELAFINAMHRKAIERLPGGRAPSCAEALESSPRDPRIDAALKDAQSNPICVPNTTVRYENTIGNNLCHLGECLETSFEQHRVIPGQTPVTVQDAAFPSDACIRPDPQLGAVTLRPTSMPWSFPAYQPALVLRHLDATLCAGTAPNILPILCSSDILRGLWQPGGTPAETGLVSTVQRSDRQAQQETLRQIAEAAGFRIGNRLYASYLEQRAQTLGDVTKAAALLLTEFGKTAFPREMCPLNATAPGNEPLPFCEPTDLSVPVRSSNQ